MKPTSSTERSALAARPTPWVIEYWPYGLRRANGLHRLHEYVAAHFSEFVDVRQSILAESAIRQPTADLPGLAAADAGPDYFTDLILLP